MTVTNTMIAQVQHAQEAFHAAPIGPVKRDLEAALLAAQEAISAALTPSDWLRTRAALPHLHDSTPPFLHHPYDRAEYEAMAAAIGLRPWDDAEIQQSAYAVKHMAPDANEIVKQTEFALARCRIMHMEGWRWDTERGLPIRQTVTMPPTAARIIRTCPICGQIGTLGEHPFSTGYADGRCDDCR